MPTTLNQNLFIEQAEYIEPESFQAWTIEHPNEENILRKLTQTGAKLITGPRGSGKTTLLLKAYNKMLQETDGAALPVYVNFKSSLKLEPLYKENADAVYLFNQWLLLKIYQGVYITTEELSISEIIKDRIHYNRAYINEMASLLEMGKSHDINEKPLNLSIPKLYDDIKLLLDNTGKSRCILLLDDAAHAFSSEQQRDFFDFFRQIKSKNISPKAAIYPGVTVYSSTFHVGHDAEEIDVWLKPQDAGYIGFMTSLLEKRLPPEVFSALLKDKSSLDLVCYASFGMPRALLNMARDFYNEDEANSKFDIKFNKRTVSQSIKDVINNTMSVYSSLKIKLPLYENFIETGLAIFNNSINHIKEYNKTKDIDNQSVTIGIKKPISPELNKVLGFFQYSGLVLPRGEMNRGNRVFAMYTIHYAALFERNALFNKKSISISEYTTAFEKRNAHALPRVLPASLIKGVTLSNAFSLSLPPCQICKTARVNESAKFCLNCGAQLKSISIFESIIKNDIDVLPLTEKRVKSIKNHSSIRLVKDILIDYENKELREVPRVGPYWANRIYSYAEEYIA